MLDMSQPIWGMCVFAVVSLIIVVGVQIIAWIFSHLVLIWGSQELSCKEQCWSLGLMKCCVLGEFFTMFHVFSCIDKEQTDPRCCRRIVSLDNSHDFFRHYLLWIKRENSPLVVNSFMFKLNVLKSINYWNQ